MFSNFHDNNQRESFQIHIKLRIFQAQNVYENKTKRSEKSVRMFVSREKIIIHDNSECN